jgi:hypothetical protein
MMTLTTAPTAHIWTLDGLLPDPKDYRARCLAQPFETVSVGAADFHGIGTAPDWSVPTAALWHFPQLHTEVSLLRRSPQGQVEPHFIHTDLDMGSWTGIYYLNPDPAPGDGTQFWRWLETGAVSSQATTEAERLFEALEWRQVERWEPWHVVPSVFNRLVVFPSSLFHSRALKDHTGLGDDARLVQVLFGTGYLEGDA